MAQSNIVDTWRHLLRYHRTTTTAMDRRLQATFGHSLDEYDVLHQISVHGGAVRMGDLAQSLLVANSSCTRIVGRLVEGGYVERGHGETDGRVVLVELTRAGNTLRRRMAAVHGRDIETRFGDVLTPTEVSALDAILRRLLESTPVVPPDRRRATGPH